MRELKFRFLNRSVTIFSVHKENAKPVERGFLKVEAPFLYKISGLGIISFGPLTLYIKSERNKAF